MRQVQLELLGLQVPRGLQVRRALQVLQVQRGPLELQVRQVLQELLELRLQARQE